MWWTILFALFWMIVGALALLVVLFLLAYFQDHEKDHA